MASGTIRDVLVVQTGQQMPGGVTELLHQQRFGTRIVQEILDAASLVDGLDCPILLVYCGLDEDHCVLSVKELLRTEELQHFPLVIIGKDIDALEGPLETRFPLVIALSTPCGNREIVDGVLYAAKQHSPEKPRQPTPSKREAPPQPAADARGPKKFTEAVEKRTGIHSLYRQFPSYPRMIFSQIRQLGIDRLTLGGRQVTKNSSLEELKKSGCLPASAEVVQEVTRIASSVSKKHSGHLCRTSFISSQIGDALKLPEQLLDSSKAASFFFAIAFAGSGSEELLEVNYLNSQTVARDEIAARMKNSAEKVRERFDEPVIANIIEAMSILVSQEDHNLDDELFLTSSMLVAADLVDRICFDRGSWSPRGAHFLMNKMKSGKLLELHPLVMSCVAKFIIEAIANLPKIFVVPRRDWHNPMYQQRARAARDEAPEEGEIQVTVTSLEPGMRLARDLVTFDGRILLQRGLILDEDLIWRIWQLSAIRLLNSPVTVELEPTGAV